MKYLLYFVKKMLYIVKKFSQSGPTKLLMISARTEHCGGHASLHFFYHIDKEIFGVIEQGVDFFNTAAFFNPFIQRP